MSDGDRQDRAGGRRDGGAPRALEAELRRLPASSPSCGPTMRRLGGLAGRHARDDRPGGGGAVGQHGRRAARAVQPAAIADVHVARRTPASAAAGAVRAARPVDRETSARRWRSAKPVGETLARRAASLPAQRRHRAAAGLILFYSVAATNGFDSFGHYLRASLIVNQLLDLRRGAGGGVLGEVPGDVRRARRRRPRRRAGVGTAATALTAAARRARAAAAATARPSRAASRRASSRRPPAGAPRPPARTAAGSARAARLPARRERPAMTPAQHIGRGEPRADRRGDGARRDRRRLPRLQREQRACRSCRPTSCRRRLPNAANLVTGNEVRIGGDARRDHRQDRAAAHETAATSREART